MEHVKASLLSGEVERPETLKQITSEMPKRNRTDEHL